MNGVELLNSKAYLKICYAISKSKHLSKDLFQETVLMIITKGYNLTPIYNNSQLNIFFSRCAWLTFHSNQFRKKYNLKVKEDRQLNEGVNENWAIEEYVYDTTLDNKVDAIIYELKSEKPRGTKDEYYNLLFKSYLENGESSGRVSTITGIPKRTVCSDILKYKQKLRYIYNEASNKG